MVVTYDGYQSGSDIIFRKEKDRLEMTSDAISASLSLREHTVYHGCLSCQTALNLYTLNVRLH